MAATTHIPSLIINGVKIEPDEMNQNLKNFAMEFGRAYQRLLDRHERGEIDLNELAKKHKDKKGAGVA